MQPTTMFQKIPIWPSRFITLLASQPMMPPMISARIKPILCSCFFPDAAFRSSWHQVRQNDETVPKQDG
jgi:hypothetical protein